MAGLELDEHVNVAIRAEVIPKHGAEEGELPDVVSPAEILDLVTGNVDILHANSILPPVIPFHGYENPQGCKAIGYELQTLDESMENQGYQTD
jgi:hypothetical protein